MGKSKKKKKNPASSAASVGERISSAPPSENAVLENAVFDEATAALPDTASDDGAILEAEEALFDVSPERKGGDSVEHPDAEERSDELELLSEEEGASSAEEISPKNHPEESGRAYRLRLVLTLTAISAAVAGGLALVNGLTKDIIADNVRKEKETAVFSVFPEADSCQTYATDDGGVVYFAAVGEYAIGYCVDVTASGYVGDIDMLVGVALDGAVVGVRIVSLSETPGVGTKVNSDSFLSQFVGRTAGEGLTVGENVDGIGGASFSSRAVAAGVEDALAVTFDVSEAAADVGLKISDAVQVPENIVNANDDNGDDILKPDEVGEMDDESTASESKQDVPEPEIPETDVPEPEIPETDVPEPEIPETDAPETGAPETVPVETETEPIPGEIIAPPVSEIEPETDAPETDDHDTSVPEPEIPETEIPETEIPETDAPDTNVPETDAPDTSVPEPEIPETDAPDTNVPEPEIPEPEIPETDAPETEAPDMIVDVEIEDEESETETKKNNSNKGPIIIR